MVIWIGWPTKIIIHKTYIGIVLGEFKEKNGTFTNELLYYEGKKKVFTQAISHFSVIDSNSSYTLVKLNPITGRKHQLRKQLLLNGHPILGDNKYRLISKHVDKKNSMMLHAYQIKFSIDGVNYKFLADLPDTFKKTLNEKHLEIF